MTTTLPAPLAGLVADLRSPDPAVRDERGYGGIAKQVSAGAADDHLVALGNAAADLLRAREIQARTFGALLLGVTVDRANGLARIGQFDLVRWLVGFAEWYVAETDLRGHDDTLGWLHAVAHGADTIRSFAGSPQLGPSELRLLLDLARDRLRAPTTHHLTQNEDDRLARAVMTVLKRDEVPTDDVRAWVDTLAASWRRAPAGPVAPEVDNALRFARALHLQLMFGVRATPNGPVRHPRDRDVILRHLEGELAAVHWFYGDPR